MQSFFVHHVRWEANIVAHGITKLAISQLLDEVWREDCPSIIRNVILAEEEAIG
jgi:hypothetical protein